MGEALDADDPTAALVQLVFAAEHLEHHHPAPVAAPPTSADNLYDFLPSIGANINNVMHRLAACFSPLRH